MTIQDELFTRLKDDAGVSAIVGTGIYPVRLPQNKSTPALVYTQISGPRLHDLGGASDRAMPRFQVDCWADTAAAAKSLADAVRASLNGFNGTLTTIKATIRLDNEQEDYDDGAKLYRVIQDYRLNHTE
jgi:hypothetical protein